MNRPSHFRYFNNWISLSGAVVAIGSAFSFLFLCAIELLTGNNNPYLGILTYLGAPAFLIIGLGMMLAGWLLYKRQLSRSTTGQSSLTFSLDLSLPSDRRKFLLFTVGTMVFLALSAIGSYKSYHVTESVAFCGEVCHAVMEPEYTTYRNGSHARVDCVECHIGSGAKWYVKSKLSGLYQVYSVSFNKYSRPIETPVRNLRPARDTCEQCHWPEKFTGNLDRSYPHYLADAANSPFTVRMSLNVGGADPRRGPPEGIHWHMAANHRVEFIAEDDQLQVIPWIRVTNQNGEVVEYTAPGFDGDLASREIHVMDCMDCHNRPAHAFSPPSQSVDQALSQGKLSTDLPGIKRLAVELLTAEYTDKAEAFANISDSLQEAYPESANLATNIEALQTIYAANFFPQMKADWSAYPNNIGHKNWPGCFRCHDDNHQNSDGSKTVEMSNCNSCHSILAQGSSPAELNRLNPAGLSFAHPGGDVEGFLCSDCHDGTLPE